jgi:PleD family two-component response regulator
LILVANDQEWAVRSIESILAPRGYAVLRAYTGRRALEHARSGQPDAIILDCQMPDLNGIEVCRILSSDPHFNVTTPIILITSGAHARDERLEALQAGAWDYCPQPLDAEVLLLKIGTFVRAKRAAERELEEGVLDQASGLYSMHGLARRAKEIGADAGRRGVAVACIAFAPDADSVEGRDRLVGEAAGRVAGHLGDICRRTGRASDAIGRLGPTEFAIIAPGTEADGARTLLTRLADAVQAEPLDLDGGEHPIRIRAGYAAVPNFAKSSVDAMELLFRATDALRVARSDRTGEAVRAFHEMTPGAT